MLDAFLARVKPALAPPLEGSPLERLHQSVVRGAEWLRSKDSPVAVRLISDVQADPVLRRLFLERFYLPRRAMNLDLVQQAIAAGELPRDTDADLLIDALTGPLYFRRIIGHAPVSEAFASELASRVLQAFRRPVRLRATNPQHSYPKQHSCSLYGSQIVLCGDYSGRVPSDGLERRSRPGGTGRDSLLGSSNDRFMASNLVASTSQSGRLSPVSSLFPCRPQSRSGKSRD